MAIQKNTDDDDQQQQQQPFGKQTTGTEVAVRFKNRIQGKRVLVTGASPNSLGEAAALAIASAGPDLLILASRTPDKLAAVTKSVEERHPGVTVRAVVLDLASQSSVRQGASRIKALTTHLDIVLNNAGVSLASRQVSPDGIELTFATNHVGPFLLTNLLLPTLIEASNKRGGSGEPGATRIINVSSSGHAISPVRFADYNFEGKPLPADEQPRKNMPAHLYAADRDGFQGMVAYGASKCANVLFSVSLNERLRGTGIRSFAVDPGDIKTNIVNHVGPEMREAFLATKEEDLKTADQGCATMLAAAFDPKLADTDAVYLSDCQPARAARVALDKRKAESLWALSEKLTSNNQSKI